eukprot:COSAG01_NODE_30553_length_613_cov_56.418288_2_plen_67_part_01
MHAARAASDLPANLLTILRVTLFQREVFIDMGLGEYVKRPTLMFGDNRNARDWAIEEMTTDGNRMID